MRAGGHQHFDGARRCRTPTHASVFLDRYASALPRAGFADAFPYFGLIVEEHRVDDPLVSTFSTYLKDNCLARWHNYSAGSQWQD